MSRRLRTAEVLLWFFQMLQYPRSLWQPDGWVRIVDSKPLTLGSHSQHLDSAWGRAGRTYGGATRS